MTPRDARAAQALVSWREIPLPFCDVIVGRGVLASLPEIVSALAPAHRYVVISDDNVAPLYGSRVADALPSDRVDVLTIPAGEAQKTRERWAQLTDEMLARGAGRDTTVVALGGGVVGDLAGFVAATYMRGIPVVQLPTTLLAMIDASIGGKTGVDTPAGKNLVGAFHQPAAVIADVATLATLPQAQRRSGLAEALKHGVIADERYFDMVVTGGPRLVQEAPDDSATDLVSRSVEIKGDVVREDEREGGLRKVLNFGHTIGHAIESESGYTLLHGEAIAIGMYVEAQIAERLGVAQPGTGERIRDALATLQLPAVKPSTLDASRILAATRSDKKARGGHVEYALPAAIGRMAGAEQGYGIPVPDALVLEVLA